MTNQEPKQLSTILVRDNKDWAIKAQLMRAIPNVKIDIWHEARENLVMATGEVNPYWLTTTVYGSEKSKFGELHLTEKAIRLLATMVDDTAAKGRKTK